MLTGGSTCITAADRHVEVECVLPSTYPHAPPDFSVRGAVTHAHPAFWSSARDELREEASKRLGAVMLFDLLQGFQERSVAAYVRMVEHEATARVDSVLTKAMFHINHMNSRAKYVKAIVAWAQELELTGEVISQTNQR